MTRREAEIHKRGQLIGFIATLFYVLLWVVLVLLVKFDLKVQVGGEGILISFGDTEVSDAGTAQSKQMAPKQGLQPEPKPEEQLTQDHEDAPVVVEKTKKKQTPKQKEEKKLQEPPKPQVNKRALFRGNASQAVTPGSGTKRGLGTQGAVNGSPDGSPEGTGSGGSGSRFDLAGRSLIGSLPKPSYDAKSEGRVVIEIRVASDGKVISAAYRSRGSTTQNATLVRAAEMAAKQARFNVDESSPIQQGTITYIFKMQ